MAKRKILIPLAALLLNLSLTDTAPCDYVRITGTVVNVRQGPGTSQTVLFQAREGDEFILIREDGLWYKVALPDGQEAYVFGRLAELMPGDFPSGQTRGEEGVGFPVASEGKGGSALFRSLVVLLLFLLAALAIWKRGELLRTVRETLREWSGYRRDKPFRYDGRSPDKDRWEI